MRKTSARPAIDAEISGRLPVSASPSRWWNTIVSTLTGTATARKADAYETNSAFNRPFPAARVRSGTITSRNACAASTITR